MKLKLLSICLALFSVSVAIAQKNLNTYKYVIVPSKYEFLNEPDLYQLNSLTAFLFEKYGFTPVMENSEFPQDLVDNGCIALKSNVLKNSGMFTTKLSVVLQNCSGQTVFTSKEGRSREKEYKTAYNLALRDAFTSFEDLNYKYDGTVAATPLVLSVPAVNAKTVSTIPATPLVPATPVNSEAKTANGILYAQETTNGYQLVDNTPKVVYKLQKTNAKDVFLVQGKSATVYKKDNQWVLEYYEGDVLKQQVLNIKF
ncbi:hypothetical protein [Pseudotamlana carrageenivorans]|uniref:Uncharacterized protein n=1 Tax=Pseudotamlana carrageenivorans TaxID=2069432 RepID=A0A2I7SFK0_9FLAO|nr:hypothetical protein [Tamlana carrageenivorans]AUS04667.1 hypothetical protein C1A40_03890 [Tamlana carrageenivorans]